MRGIPSGSPLFAIVWFPFIKGGKICNRLKWPRATYLLNQTAIFLLTSFAHLTNQVTGLTLCLFASLRSSAVYGI